MTLPIGSIVASILTLADFRNHMPHDETWELANGEHLPPTHGLAKVIKNGGTEYATLNPNNTPTKPNLNGVFLRGRDYASTDANFRNPDKHVLVGTYQEDALGKHNHRVDIVDHNDSAHNGTTPNGGWRLIPLTQVALHVVF